MKNLIILGNFDGVHLGHQNLVKKAVEYAKNKDLKVVVYTFKTLSNKKEYITTLKERENLLLDLGVDIVYFDDFYNVKKLSPQEFIEKVLIDKLNAAVCFCGYNYQFGYMREGNSDTLKQNIKTIVVDEYRLNDKLVSSSKIRELLYLGDIESVNELLNHTFNYKGIVRKGRQLGRLIGFPTANIYIEENRVKLVNGVYGTTTKIEGYDKEFYSITNVGYNPTISSNNSLTVETNIFDFNDDIYGKKIEVKFLKMIRPEIKFETVQKLKEQIKKDSENWRKINARY